jgi:hypothetical protein
MGGFWYCLVWLVVSALMLAAQVASGSAGWSAAYGVVTGGWAVAAAIELLERRR